jgi:hypothetical protein
MQIRSMLLAKALLASLAMVSLGTASHAEDRGPGWDYWWLGDPIEGLWDVTVSITPPPPSPGGACPGGPPLATFKAMALFGRGGTLHDLNDTGKAGPFPRSPGLGTWERAKWRHYQFAFKYFVFDTTTGAPAGWAIIRHDVVLARDGKSYVSDGTAENFDASGAPIGPGVPGRPPVGCSSSTAVRFE